MSVDVLGALQKYLSQDGKSINVTPDISAVFGPAVGSAVQEIFSGGLQVNGANFSLDGSAAIAKISGTGSAAPMLQQIQVSAIFTATANDVTLAFTASIVSAVPISSAWPSQLNFFPFNALTLTGGDMSLNVDPGAKSFDLVITPTVSFEGTPLGTGLLEVSYDGKTLGYLGGFMVSGSWTPFNDIPVLKTLTLVGELGAFFSTITASDLDAFKGFPFPPKSIDPGLTVLGMITLDKGSLSPLQKFVGSGAKLELTAIVPKDGGLSKASIAAIISEPTSSNALALTNFGLTWKSTSADSGTITLAVVATLNISRTEALAIEGSGIFTYGTSPSLTISLQLTATGGWLHPFGIPNLTILTVAFSCTLSDEGIGVAMAGTIQIGTDDQKAVLLTAGAGFEDFEVPDYIAAELSAEDKDKSVTLANLITDFIPSLDLTHFPLLNSISFKDLQFWAVAAPVTILNKTYNPGIGASGEISFFGYQLDFAFNLITSPSIAVQAKGTISQNGGPLVISGGGITWLTISNDKGDAGASACIDTTASGYCDGITAVPNAYFAINGKITLLGLVSASVVAAASKDVFELDMDLSAGSVFSEKLHVLFNPSSAAFAASTETDFSPPDITLGPWGIIPQFTIPTPKISVCLALGTILPSAPPCSDGWMPGSAPYFHFDLHFSWIGIDFDLAVSLEINDIVNALSDFGSFLKNWLLNNALTVLDFILKSAELLTKLLLKILTGIVDLVRYVATLVAKQIGILFEEAYKLASDIWDELQKICAVGVGNAAMSNSQMLRAAAMPAPGAVDFPALTATPRVLADLIGSEKGNALLYHYYSHRSEMDAILRDNTPIRDAAAALISNYQQTAEYEREIYLPLVIDLIKTAAPAGSADFQESAQVVIGGLEPYRNETYPALLEVLAAG
jgi:hypothetical protein